MNVGGTIDAAEEVERGEAAPRKGIGQVAVTAVFTFTCFTVPVLTVDGADGRLEIAGRAEVSTEAAPTWSEGAVALEVKDLKARFRAEQQALMERYQEQWKLARDASREERERIRLAFQDEQTELASRQKELREELKSQLAQFKREHPDHLGLIEAAREAAKARSGPRRGASAG